MKLRRTVEALLAPENVRQSDLEARAAAQEQAERAARHEILLCLGEISVARSTEEEVDPDVAYVRRQFDKHYSESA